MSQYTNDHGSVTKSLISVGGNLSSHVGSVRETIAFALELLACESVAVLARSRDFDTPAYPAGSGPNFVNAAVEVETRFSAADLIDHLHGIEKKLRRTRDQRWEPRIIDLDLLSYGDAVLPDMQTYEAWRNMPLDQQKAAAPEQLILPHPRMHERSFVLVPLMDIAADWTHPVLQQTIRELVESLPPSDTGSITAL